VGGIIGKLSFDRDVRVSPATVQRMLDAIGHRGTAATGTYIGHGIALGWCGDEAAASPYVAHNETCRVRVVADADLSNAKSLRQTLERLGHIVAEHTDAELIAHAYEEWGDACVARLEGPFAFAIWDEDARRLLLARDHLGIRPLCFALLHGDGVVFASELKAVLQDPSVGREWHPEAIDAYLALGYVPSPLTIYRRVSKLEPAHTLVVEGRRLTTRQYWDFSVGPSTGVDEREALDFVESRLRTRVATAIDRVNTGVLMSGGVASTAIAAMLHRGRTSVAVGIEQDYSELDRIASTAAHLGLRSDIDVAEPAAGVVARILAQHFDEPTADPAAVSQYAVFLAARRYIEIAVTGHGTAALWAGTQPTTLFDNECRHLLYTRRFSWQIRNANPFARDAEMSSRCTGDDELTRALYAAARTWLPDERLASADRTAAAAGLRLRHPLLDREVADLAFALPGWLKARRGEGMYALRRIVARHLPASLMPPACRQTVPQAPWLAGALQSLVPSVLLTDRFDTRGIFSRPALTALWEEHQAGRVNHAQRLWAVLMLEFWFQEFIDGDAAAEPAEYAVLVRAA
jgi:asparagine synthase (glutamine-hydrolysing)